MKNTFAILLVLLACGQGSASGLPDDLSFPATASSSASQDSVAALLEMLNALESSSDNALFKKHCSSIIAVIEAKQDLSANERSFLEGMYAAFSDSSEPWNAGKLSSYRERKRPFIISWTSPTDSVVSLAWLLPPENWDPEQSYPLYVSLHGLYDPYQNPIEYMARYLSPGLTIEKSFEDGYGLYPWGRGNLWYEGISETDVLESISAAEAIVKVNPARKYLVGHSMGGYGAWAIGQKSPDTWAALGIYAGALWYGGNKLLNAEAAQKLKDVPVYIVCGDRDGLLGNNLTAYQLLQNAGNTNLFFTTFPGGHESLLENWEDMYQWIRNWTNDASSVAGKQSAVSEFSLLQNYPNPFNPSTTITYSLPAAATVTLEVLNMLGQRVRSLANEKQEGGIHSVVWEGTDDLGQSVSSGVYVYRLRAGDQVLSRKMLLIE